MRWIFILGASRHLSLHLRVKSLGETSGDSDYDDRAILIDWGKMPKFWELFKALRSRAAVNAQKKSLSQAELAKSFAELKFSKPKLQVASGSLLFKAAFTCQTRVAAVK